LPSPPKPAPLFRAARAIRRKCSSRRVNPNELSVTVLREPRQIDLRFYVARKVLQLDVVVSALQARSFREVTFVPAAGEARVVGHAVTTPTADGIRFTIFPPRVELIDRIAITFANLERQFGYRIKVHCPKALDPDLRHMRRGFDRYDAGDHHEALAALQAYCTHSRENPWVLLCMAKCLNDLGDFEAAQVHAVGALVRAPRELADHTFPAYQDCAWRTWPATAEHRSALREACNQWELDEQHGLVALELWREFQLDFGGWCLQKTREIYEVRRPLAARMLSRVSFDFAGQDHLLFTACRIIRQDGRILDLPQERLVVGDDPERNVSIATKNEKTGVWLLPELTAGDQIEWCHHLLTPEVPGPGDPSQRRVFVSRFCKSYLPTYRGVITIRAPRDAPLHIRLRSAQSRIAREEQVEGEWRRVTLVVRKHLPIHLTNLLHETYVYNPVAAFTGGDHDWPTVVRLALERSIGSPDGNDELPPSLRRHLVPRPTLEEALRQAFYWVRDKLKYAAVGSAEALIGQSGRAQAIVQSGVAACRDRAYLLSLVCRELDVPFQFVAVSARRGILFRDLPGEQCDHVFLRVRLNDRWLYLDASDSGAIFGSCPLHLQGLECVVLEKDGTFMELPVDPPEANTLHVAETFGRIDGDRLGGEFHLSAQGIIARLVDEQWKLRTLGAMGRIPAAQAVLQGFLPALILSDFTRRSHTADSDRFEVVGEHRRGLLSSLGGRRIGALGWHVPLVPLDAWRSNGAGRAFVFPVPLTVHLSFRAVAEVAERVAGLSELPALDNALGRIREERFSSAGEAVLEREIVLKKKFVGQDELHLVGPSLEAIERALQVAFILAE